MKEVQVKQPATLTPRAQSFYASLTAIVTALANLSNTVGRVLADGKIAGTEYLDLILTTPNVQVIIQNAPQAAKDFLVIDDLERAALAEQFAQQFDIPSDQVEAKIETTLKEALVIAGAGRKMVASVSKLYSTWKPKPATDVAAG